MYFFVFLFFPNIFILLSFQAKRQQRKLNFLITQTELYAHFMSRKIDKASAEEQLRILNQLDEEKNTRLIVSGLDNYDRY